MKLRVANKKSFGFCDCFLAVVSLKSPAVLDTLNE